MQKNFVRAVAQGALDPAAQTWPGPAELTLLRLVGLVWSTSDLSHPVAAGALLLIGQYLGQARVRSLADLASGLFLCSLVSQYEAESKRLVPEVINFLLNALLLLLPSPYTPKTTPGSFPSPDLGQDHVKAIKLRLPKDDSRKMSAKTGSKGKAMSASNGSSSLSLEQLEPSSTLNFLACLRGSDSDVQLRIDLAGAAILQLQDFAEKSVSLDAFIELFSPCETIVNKLSSRNIPVALKVSTVPRRTRLGRTRS